MDSGPSIGPTIRAATERSRSSPRQVRKVGAPSDIYALVAIDALARDHPQRSIDADGIAGVILTADPRPEAARLRWRAAYQRSPAKFLQSVEYHPPEGMQEAIRRAVLSR